MTEFLVETGSVGVRPDTLLARLHEAAKRHLLPLILRRQAEPAMVVVRPGLRLVKA